MRNQLAEDIKRRLMRRGLTYKAAAREVGIAAATLHKAAHAKPILHKTYLKIYRWLREAPPLGDGAVGVPAVVLPEKVSSEEGARRQAPKGARAKTSAPAHGPDEYGEEYTPPATIGFAGNAIPGERRILDEKETPMPPPPNYVRASTGRYIPASLLAHHDVACDRLVRRILGRGERLEREIADFRGWVIREILEHIDELVRAYGSAEGLSASTGNIKLSTHDGMYQVRLERADRVVFDDRIHAAKEYIDRAIRRWSEGAHPQLRLLVDEAFEVDKIGRLNTRRILELTRYDIDDEDWQSGIRAIKDSIKTERGKWYVRLYRKPASDGPMRYIPIDLQKTPASEPAEAEGKQ